MVIQGCQKLSLQVQQVPQVLQVPGTSGTITHLLSNLYQPPNFTMTPSVGQQTIGEKSFGAYQTSLPAGKQLHTKSKMRRFPVLSGFQAQADYRGYTSETTEEKLTSKRKRQEKADGVL